MNAQRVAHAAPLFLLGACVTILVLWILRLLIFRPLPTKPQLDDAPATRRDFNQIISRAMTLAATFTFLGFSFTVVGGWIIRIKGGTTTNPPTTQDSPVTVRGGSIVIHSPDAWTPELGIYSTSVDPLQKGYSAVLVSLDGVEGKNDTTPSFVPLGIQNDWQITMTFRDKDGKDNPKYILTLCTALNKLQTACSYDSNSVGSTVYMLDNGGGKIYGDKLDQSIEKYDLTNCDQDTAGTNKCNHISTVTVTTYQGSTPYKCVDGTCTISIGK